MNIGRKRLNSEVENYRIYMKIIELWKRFSCQIEDMFGLTPGLCPSRVEVIAEDCVHQNFGGLLSNDVLYITNKAINETIPLEGIIAKVCMETALPKKGFCTESINDICVEFARQILGRKENKTWIKLWSLNSPKKKLGTIMTHNPSVFFPLLYDLVGAVGLQRIVQEICAMAKCGVQLNYTDYLAYLKTRLRQSSINLNQTDLKIVNVLLHNGTCSYTNLGEQIGISSEWVSRRISSLRSLSILRRFERVPFSKVGIRMFHLFISSGNKSKDPLEFLLACPFLYCYRKILTGYWDALSTLAIPDNESSIESITEFLHTISKWGFQSSLIEVISSGTIDCFDFYDTNIGTWAIPWELLNLQIRKIYDDRLASAFPRIDQPASKSNFILDELDFKILNQIRKGNSSVGKVRNALHIGQENAANRLKRLRSAGLIQTTWEVQNIGLNESLLVFCADKKTGESIVAWAQRLPRSIVSFNDLRELVMISRLPHGGCFNMSQALSTLTQQVSVEILGTMIYGGWGFPTDLWDSYTQQWLFPEVKVRNWLKQLK